MKGKQTFRSKVHVLRYLHMLGNGGVKSVLVPTSLADTLWGRKKEGGKKNRYKLPCNNYIIKLNPEHGEKLCIMNKILITVCTLQHNQRWIIHHHFQRKSMHHSTWGKHRGFHWYDFSLGTMTKCRSPAGNWSTELCSMCHKSTLQPTGCLSGTNIPSIFQ